MIEEITLKSGSSDGAEKTKFNPLPITIFVGPNNSGKSKVLSELFKIVGNGRTNQTLILEKIKFKHFTEEEANLTYQEILDDPNSRVVHGMLESSYANVPFHESIVKETLKNPNSNPSSYCIYAFQGKKLNLNGNNRLNLVNKQSNINLQNPNQSLGKLFTDDDKRALLRSIIYESLKQYLIVNPSIFGEMTLSLSNEEPLSYEFERSLSKESLEFYSNAEPVLEKSDGTKAYIGILTEIIAGNPLVLFKDEPEAFLHPPLAYSLGKDVSKLVADQKKRLFVATHSSDFLMGCLQSGVPLNIIRLTYSVGVATSRILNNEDISILMRNPLLRSAKVLNGLFYDCIVVTESDTDRAFYQEINDRLLEGTENKGIKNCLFINAQNKQTLKTIITPLRKLGIPTVGIADIDVIKEGGTVWTSLMKSISMPDMDIETLNTTRRQLKEKFDVSGKNMKKDGGIDILTEEDQEGMNNFLNKLKEYGLFVIPKGELEVWLPELEVSGHGPKWLIEMFEKMGDNPASENYIKASNGDVWSFIDSINDWCSNPNKKGIPK